MGNDQKRREMERYRESEREHQRHMIYMEKESLYSDFSSLLNFLLNPKLFIVIIFL